MFKICAYGLIIIFSILFRVKFIFADFYSATNDLEILLHAEAYLIENLEHYLVQSQHNNQKIENFLSDIEYITSEVGNDTTAFYYGDPITDYKTINRLVNHWKSKVYDNIYGTAVFEDYKRKLLLLAETNFIAPTEDDFVGAVRALVRLQDTYQISAFKLANGNLLNINIGSSLSASDCFQLGRILLELKIYKYAIEWLLVARAQLKFDLLNNAREESFPPTSEARILEYLAPVLFDDGNTKLAQILNNELLNIEPSNEYALENKFVIQNRLIGELNQKGIINKCNNNKSNEDVADDADFSNIYNDENDNLVYTKTDETENDVLSNNYTTWRIDTSELYKLACRGELHQTHRLQRTLNCRLTHNNLAFRLIGPFKMEQLNHDPYVVIYHDAIYESEMQQIINLGKFTIERSKVGETNASVVSDIRTSKTTWLYYNQHNFLLPVRRRLEDITGISTDSVEPLQVVNYGIGGHYEPYFDFGKNSHINFGNNGNRLLTALFYINEVQLGGATVFPFLRLAVPPIRGSLLLWYNLHSSYERDFRTKHAACPVLKGSKWICNTWFH